MKRSYLIQRLLKPPTLPENKKDKLFSVMAFGGGLKNGGLSDEAMKLLRKIFLFDYMGSAEFGWGTVPKALEKIVQLRDKYIATRAKVPYYYREWCFDKDAPKDRRGEVEIGVICQKSDLEEVISRIKVWADDNSKGKPESDLKERTLFPLACSGIDRSILRGEGWLELDNGFFWFIDDEMFQKTANLFGISVES